MPYPIRLPENKLRAIHPSAEAAFEAHDYLWVCRYGRDNPELLGCALLFLGNRVGAEKVLGNIDTPRVSLYRKWFGTDDHTDNYRIVVYHDDAKQPFRDYLYNIPGIEVIKAPYNPPASFDPGHVDLVMADFEIKPHRLAELSEFDINNFGAPVAFTPGDHEWYWDQYHKIMDKIDFLCCGSSSESAEVARYFEKPSVVSCLFPKRSGFTSRWLSERFNGKSIDLLSTGWMLYDFYRDKIERVLPLAYTIDKRFSVKIIDGYLSLDDYKTSLRAARFMPISTRYSGYWSGRNVEALQSGVINLVSEESCMPYVFSEMFACFQVVRNDHYNADVEKHLNRYDEIIEELGSRLPRLEAEMCSMFPDDEKLYWGRYLRRLLFIAHIDRDKFKPHKPPHIKPSASFWLRKAMTISPEYLKEGLQRYPNSLSLNYAEGIILFREGKTEEATKRFQRIVDDKYVLFRDDLFPYPWESLHGCFWIMDARVRERHPNELAQLAPEINVWKSFSLSYLAIMAPILIKTAAYAKKAIDLFKYNDIAEGIYLSAHYQLYKAGSVRSGEAFLQSYKDFQIMDGRIMRKFSDMAIDILKSEGKDTKQIEDEVGLFRSRTNIK